MKENKLICLMVLVSLIFLAGGVLADSDKYYEINLSYDKGNFSLNSLNMEFSSETLQNYGGEYLVQTVDFRKNKIDSMSLGVPNQILYDEVNENGTIVSGGMVILNETNFTIYVPYHENASEVVVYDENMTEKLSIDVSKYSKVDRKLLKDVEVNESEKAREQNVSDNESYEEEKRREPSEILRDYWWTLVIVLIVLLVVLFYSLKKDLKNINKV